MAGNFVEKNIWQIDQIMACGRFYFGNFTDKKVVLLRMFGVVWLLKYLWIPLKTANPPK